MVVDDMGDIVLDWQSDIEGLLEVLAEATKFVEERAAGAASSDG